MLTSPDAQSVSTTLPHAQSVMPVVDVEVAVEDVVASATAADAEVDAVVAVADPVVDSVTAVDVVDPVADVVDLPTVEVSVTSRERSRLSKWRVCDAHNCRT